MPLDPPKSGDPILKTDIEEMFSSVTKTVNNLEAEHIARSAFGPQHFNPGNAWSEGMPTPAANTAGIVTHSDSKSFSATTQVELAYAAVSTATSDILPGGGTEWTEITNLRIDNSGDGYNTEPGQIIVFGSLRLRRWEMGTASAWPVDGSGGNRGKWWTMIACTYDVTDLSSGEMVKEETILGHEMKPKIYYQKDTDGQKFIQEQTFSWWYALDTSALDGPVKLNALRVRGAKMRATGEALAADDNPEIAGGYHGFFVLKSD